MANLFGEVAIWKTGYVCLNAGWEVETILITVTTALKIYDCYQTLLNTIMQPFTWTDIPNFSNCAYSDDEEVTLKEWDIVTADKITYWLGGADTTSCFPGKILPASTAILLHEVVLP